MGRSLPLLFALLFAVASSGCVRSAFEGSIRNLTEDAHEVTIVVTRVGERTPLSEETYHIPPAEQDHPLGTLFRKDGTYHIGVSLENGTGVQETIEWSKKTGPDALTVWLRPEPVDVDISIV